MNGREIEVCLYGKGYNTDIKKAWLVAPPDEMKRIREKDHSLSVWGTWGYHLDEMDRYVFQIPFYTGAYLDNVKPLWFTKVKYKKRDTSENKWFTKKRTENAIELMELLHGCAKKAGFPQYFFVGFGTLLGIIREGDFIGSDKDMDHCIAGYKINKQKEEKFLIEIARAREIDGRMYPRGLYEGRCRKPQRRKDNKRFLWTSVGHKKIHGEKGVKSCIWKFFEHDKFAWHGKGGKWIHARKFDPARWQYDFTDEALAKGLEYEYVQKFVQIKFKGIKVNVPKLAGHCLDTWYPGWARPKKGASRKKYVLIIPEWKNKKTWRMALG